MNLTKSTNLPAIPLHFYTATPIFFHFLLDFPTRVKN